MDDETVPTGEWAREWLARLEARRVLTVSDMTAYERIVAEFAKSDTLRATLGKFGALMFLAAKEMASTDPEEAARMFYQAGRSSTGNRKSANKLLSQACRTKWGYRFPSTSRKAVLSEAEARLPHKQEMIAHGDFNILTPHEVEFNPPLRGTSIDEFFAENKEMEEAQEKRQKDARKKREFRAEYAKSGNSRRVGPRKYQRTVGKTSKEMNRKWRADEPDVD